MSRLPRGLVDAKLLAAALDDDLECLRTTTSSMRWVRRAHTEELVVIDHVGIRTVG